MNELKPCPFCNSEAKVYAFTSGGICVKCMNCYCQTQIESDFCIADAKEKSAYEKVIEAWNRRVENEQ